MKDDYELNAYDDENTFLQDYDRPGGETSISSPTSSIFKICPHTTQKKIERDTYTRTTPRISICQGVCEETWWKGEAFWTILKLCPTFLLKMLFIILI